MSDNHIPFSNIRNNPGIALGITELMIEDLVASFYAKVRKDKLIGPIFDEIIKDNWDEHLSRMCEFWSSIALSTGRYKGQPLLKHIHIPNLNKEHFNRWLHIFEENASSNYSKDIAEFFIDRAKRIAESLMLGINFYRGNLDLKDVL
jgi:hemoglobin